MTRSTLVFTRSTRYFLNYKEISMKSLNRRLALTAALAPLAVMTPAWPRTR